MADESIPGGGGGEEITPGGGDDGGAIGQVVDWVIGKLGDWFGSEYPKPLPGRLPYDAPEVADMLAVRTRIADGIRSIILRQGHSPCTVPPTYYTAICSGTLPQTALEPLDDLAAIALWYAGGTGDDLSRDEDTIRGLIVQGMAGLGGGDELRNYYCPGQGLPTTILEVQVALDRTPAARLQQLYEVIRQHNPDQGLTGDYLEDLYSRITEWPRWAMGGDNCTIDDPAEEQMRTDFLDWWEQYQPLADVGDGSGGGPSWWERLIGAAVGIVTGDRDPGLPPGTQPQILGVSLPTFGLLVLAVVLAWLYLGRRS